MDPVLRASKKYAKKYILLIIAIVFVLILAIPYAFGFRLGPGVKLERVGTLTITGLPKSASVFVDQALRDTTSSPGDMKDELVGGSHAVIVSVNGDYPWSTLALITSGKSTTINPILVSTQPNVTPLSGTDKTTAIAAIASSTLPSVTSPLKLANGCINVYVTNNQVIADPSATAGCTPPPYLCASGTCAPTIIFSPKPTLIGVAQYPFRQDALVVEFENTLYAIALDPRSPQFFAPILTGTQPIMGVLSNGTIVVRNGDAVYRVNL